MVVLNVYYNILRLKMDLFKVLNSCLKGPRASDEEIAQISSWMLCRWLSGDPRTIEIANCINQLSDMPIDAQYNFVRGLLHDKMKFIRFPKTPKNVSDKMTLRIAERYRCNPSLVPELLSLMSEEEIKEFSCEL